MTTSKSDKLMRTCFWSQRGVYLDNLHYQMPNSPVSRNRAVGALRTRGLLSLGVASRQASEYNEPQLSNFVSTIVPATTPPRQGWSRSSLDAAENLSV